MGVFFHEARRALGLSQERVAPIIGRSITQTRTYDRGGAEPPGEVWQALKDFAEGHGAMDVAAEINAYSHGLPLSQPSETPTGVSIWAEIEERAQALEVEAAKLRALVRRWQSDSTDYDDPELEAEIREAEALLAGEDEDDEQEIRQSRRAG